MNESTKRQQFERKKKLVQIASNIRWQKLQSSSKPTSPKKGPSKPESSKKSGLDLRNSLTENDSVVGTGPAGSNTTVKVNLKTKAPVNNFIKDLEEASFVTKIPNTNTLVLHLPKDVKEVVFIERKTLNLFLDRISRLIDKISELPEIILEEHGNERVQNRLMHSLNQLADTLSDWTERLEDDE